MKMSYRRNHTSERRKRALVGIVGVVLAVFLLGKLFDPLADAALFAATPLWKAGIYTKSYASAIFAGAFISPDVVRENKELRQRIAELEAEEALTRSFRRENATLKAHLSVPSDTAVQSTSTPLRERGFLTAAILARAPRTPYGVLTVDAGARAGVDRGDPVYASKHVRLGTVADTAHHTAKVALFSSPGTKTNAMLAGAEKSVAVELTGRGNGAFEAQLPHNILVAKGDVFVLPGNRLEAVAVVEKVEESANSPFQLIHARAPVNIQELFWVILK